ncbi:hypothetical protein A1O3_06825 [Capronia epimyces CBS 606.96]|uniref:Uncharacterized protein n=1 Tax=Capronia epimyces CBS 606.96 TaxID=1182542 RepID=W9XS12_9EURO|nr:uncharacterized protein A1O3_06825 [Capronia epimyces CBS 606.96]EXJ83008.1 hypothetical protein A1O3_06825 [Capronia epimyces CBS 606.96]
MAWYSILPSHLTTYETWIIRAFLVLAIINIAPWIIAILYDLLYYVGRIVWHEVPIWGGRARGERRPRAPSLRDRNRSLSLAGMVTGTGSPADAPRQSRDERDARSQMRAANAGTSGPRHRQTLSSRSIEEEKEEDDT